MGWTGSADPQRQPGLATACLTVPAAASLSPRRPHCPRALGSTKPHVWESKPLDELARGGDPGGGPWSRQAAH